MPGVVAAMAGVAEMPTTVAVAATMASAALVSRRRPVRERLTMPSVLVLVIVPPQD
ncbi:hypothetical protein GCM10023170_056750 [Phytohabitans houttuyneae]|uniref:Uncharacterized protein n=1 Tax=Phytohabitans houttuyneae TaxID=1076126 RepID=A0A6V8KIN9_9ACTN|nr:hypothetical protein Phou_047650 [Phytohabitans houttuyneae]